MKFDLDSITPGISTLPSGNLTRSNSCYSCAWRGLVASSEMECGLARKTMSMNSASGTSTPSLRSRFVRPDCVICIEQLRRRGDGDAMDATWDGADRAGGATRKRCSDVRACARQSVGFRSNAEIPARASVRYVPKAAVSRCNGGDARLELFDHLISAANTSGPSSASERLRRGANYSEAPT